MSEILSQSEIDNLLKALSSGELNPVEIQTTTSEKKVTPYDFKRPNKFAKEHLRTIHFIFDNYSRLLSSYLSGTLRAVTHVEVISVEELTFHEYYNSLSNPVLLSIIESRTLKGTLLMEMLPKVAFGMIDRLLGGQGISIDKVRDFTEIELTLLEKIIKKMITILEEPWENVIDLQPKLDKIETNIQFAQIYSPNEMVALATINIKIGDIDGMLNLCIPYMTIESVVPKLNTRHWFSVKNEEKNEKDYKPIIESKLQTAQIPVKAVLGSTTVSLADVLHLNIGDVIKLDTHKSAPVTVMVGDEDKFLSNPGIHKGRVAVQITTKLRREEK